VSEGKNEVRPLTYDALRQSVESAAALRCRRRLQPAGGPGDKVFPPTYAGAVYAVERRRVPGREEPVTCVLLDSVQSQANRMEEALQEAIDEGTIAMPLIVVDFTGAKLLEPVGRISSLQAPHRLADAILRDSEYNKKPFRESAIGSEVDRASLAFATPLLRLCPQALIFGLWDSTGPKGGLGTKFERAVLSEVTAIGIAQPERDERTGREFDAHMNRGVRRDPLGIRAAVKVQKEAASWKIAGEQKAKGVLSPAEINHSSVPFESANAGVTCEYIEQTTTLSLIALRRLRFPLDENAAASQAANVAARALLAAMGLCAATLAFGSGMDLRSRCVLFPEGPMAWDLLDVPGQAPRRYAMEKASAIQLLKDATAAARKTGLPWNTDSIVLTPSKQLVELIRMSQELAVREPE
jgi:CRISPR-associated protein Csb1